MSGLFQVFVVLLKRALITAMITSNLVLKFSMITITAKTKISNQKQNFSYEEYFLPNFHDHETMRNPLVSYW